MMRLLCNNVSLDLYNDAGLQFTHDNPLFAFDELKCERTTQFKLPRTATNDRVFSLARIPAYDGIGMRRKFDAQLQASSVVKDGYLYVSDYDGKDYNAIFVTGEYIGLQAIKNAGKVPDLIGDPRIFAYWSTFNQYGTLANFDVLQYKQLFGGNKYIPSVTMKYLIETAMSNIGASCPAIEDSYRIIPKTPKTASGALNYKDTYAESWSSSYGTTNTINNINLLNSGSAGDIFTRTAFKIRYKATNTPNYMYGYISQLICNSYDVRISFPDNFSSNYFIVSFPATAGETPHDDPAIYKEEGIYEIGCTIGVFLGDYSFNVNWSTSTKTAQGTPLAGRTIVIPKGTPFTILDWYDFEVYAGGSAGWYTPFGSEFTFYLEEDNAVQDAIIPLFGNIPNVTLVELLKTYASLIGKVLTYDSANGVQFDSLSIASWPVVYLDGSAIKRGKVTRTFGDYAQENIISFHGDDTQFASDKLKRVYSIDNDNIENTKELQVIPLSEGCLSDGNDALLLRNTEEELAPPEFTLGQTHGDRALHRVALPQNSGLKSLCDDSTQYVVSCRLTLLEYEAITPKTLIQIDGTRYVWTSRSWQKDEAQFTLAKVS